MTQTNGNANGRRRIGPLWMPQQMHAGLDRRSAALASIARDTAGDDVLPVFSAALGDRHHMIECQFRGGETVTAVLARVVVARVDVRAGEGHVVETPFDLDVPQQADDR